jgi:hypothetical protein
VLELEGTVNQDDHFGIAFYCLGDPLEEELALEIQSAFTVFLNVEHRVYQGVDEGQMTWDSLPEALIDNEGRLRGAGSRPDRRFSIFKLGYPLVTGHTLGIATFLRLLDER